MRVLHCRVDGGALRPSAGAIRDVSRRMDALLPHHAPVRGALSILADPGQVNPVGCARPYSRSGVPNGAFRTARYSRYEARAATKSACERPSSLAISRT